MELPDRVDAKRWEGLEVVDRDDHGLGTCVGVFADADTEITEWLLVDVPGHRPALLPALDAVDADGRVRVPFAREQVVTAPAVGDETQLSKGDEKVLYDHYGVSYSDDDSTSLLPEGAAPEPVTAAEPLEEVPAVHDAGSLPPTAARQGEGVSPGEVAAPLAAVGGLVVAVWFVLRVRGLRVRRR